MSSTRENLQGYDIWKLKNTLQNGRSVEVWVNATHGMNMCKLILDEHVLIDWDLERCKKQLSYGTPILYPAPNRVKDDQFTFWGQTYTMPMHGVIRFKDNELGITQLGDMITLKGEYHFLEGTKLYEEFPIESTLELSITLNGQGIELGYKVINHSDQELPYGFGLHPFFQKIGDTYIQVKSEYVMEKDEDKLPTAEVIRVNNTSYNLNNYRDVSELNLDDVYIRGGQRPEATIWYKDLGFKVHLQGTEEFGHIVVYIPAGQDFFCIENQTCSTNAYNLHQQGHAELSGLQIVNPQQYKQGKVSYSFE